MAQLSYSYNQKAASPGGLRDTSPHMIVARANGEPSGKVKFGMGVVQGVNPGKDVKLPDTGSGADLFEGVVAAGVKQMDLQGNTALDATDTLGVLKWGAVWVRLAEGLTVAYGERLYLINAGADAGMFTNESTDAIAVNGKFTGGVESGDIAPVELFNQSAAIESALSDHETRIADHETRIAALETA
jgi:hypothetical protein